ncbi:hypothetical protein JHL18_03525 [Clostridium sp. YIM B02505]|uniref:Uncharacterized protein n=1 Tax=Clostridium yunnanense TaxID=2800325 RepID=A0ABS1EK11_9CLOT|nr:hypothetical protein [Clostridium yunnanense]MBK1809708.1 hypothetical protein [Clostridium yunnanense]
MEKNAFDLGEVLIDYEIQKLLKYIEGNSIITEVEVSIERKILSVARNYDNGVYEKCEYMKPNDAYDCIRYICEFERKQSIVQYIDEIEYEIDKMIKGNCYNKSIIEKYIKNMVKFLNNKSLKESEFKKCGREYEFFNF